MNWCPELGTVLANEEVIDGKSERGGHPVVRMPLRQWMLRITAYADRLLDDLKLVDWPEPIKEMQRNWIGQSEGAEVVFSLEALPSGRKPGQLRIFTTRPDTLFGATYMVLAPEHPLVDVITTAPEKQAVEEYRIEAGRKSDLERTELAKAKTGVFTGAYALNPVNGESIPIWIADYVLISYGTGAIMAVPGHDERDFEFAQRFGLPIRPVVQPPLNWLRGTNVFQAVRGMRYYADAYDADGKSADEARPDRAKPPTLLDINPVTRATYAIWERCGGDTDRMVASLYATRPDLFQPAFTGEGTAINSGLFNDLPTPEFKKKIISWLAERGLGRAVTSATGLAGSVTGAAASTFTRSMQGQPMGIVEPPGRGITAR